MAEGAAAVARKVGAIEIPEAAIRSALRSRQSSSTSTAPTENAIFKIIFDEALDMEQKRAELAKYLVFTGSKEESKARIKAYMEFEEFLSSERERMSREVIRLTDTETFSELQAVYNDLNTALIDFDDRMRPLTEIIDAIYVLRTNDKTMDAFREIQEDRQAEVARKQEEQVKEAQFRSISDRVTKINASISDLREKRTFFGFGSVTESARQEIARNEREFAEAQEQLETLGSEIRALNDDANRQSQLGEFTAQKAKLRELLDISSDDHKQRQRELVDAAMNFVDKAKSRIGSVRDHLGKMTDQIDALYDANSKMTNVYAVMSEGIKDAANENKTIRQSFQAHGEESLIAKMAREEKLSAVEDHIRTLDTASGSTIETFADLTSQTIRIRSMKDSNESQIDKARRMHGQGVAGVADRLSVVLNAVSSAALGESSAMAKGTLEGMIDRTNKVAQKEVIQVAMGVREINRDVEKAISDLGDFGEVLRASTEIYRSGLTEVHQNIDRMRDLAEEVRGDIKNASGVRADVSEGSPDKKTTKGDSPFGIGR